jgi:hypothetical protein
MFKLKKKKEVFQILNSNIASGINYQTKKKQQSQKKMNSQLK